ncbi:MAG: thioredoxin domain-containing protein [Leadbetterella sp.]|jgi:uncharacterized protein YyaL (SSP411 family)|nr:thioredoxin domain-containing protein [Leadbetterella sp.]
MNHLANETSQYLLQHRNNPVDWFPWGPKALQKSANENKVIILSISYSVCHLPVKIFQEDLKLLK